MGLFRARILIVLSSITIYSVCILYIYVLNIYSEDVLLVSPQSFGKPTEVRYLLTFSLYVLTKLPSLRT